MKECCEYFIDRYLALDKGQRVPLGLALHLLTCRGCRKAIWALVRAERVAARPLSVATPVDADSVFRVMRRVDSAYRPKNNSVPLWRWIGEGLLLVATVLSFVLFFTGETANQPLSFALYLIFAGIITVYCVMFIGSNLDFFIKRIPTLRPGV